jgi:acetyltransferase-like isoleucine patch superfamily enzyme
VIHPDRIGLGANVVIMEHGTLRVGVDAADAPLLLIGDHVRLGRFNTVTCSLAVTIGDSVASSDGVTITDTWDPVLLDQGPTPLSWGARRRRMPPARPVVIESGAYLGASSTILPGVRIGTGAYVGEGAVVTGDVPAHAVVRGNPAVVVSRADQYPATRGR